MSSSLFGSHSSGPKKVDGGSPQAQLSEPRYAVGIDLGTTHSVLAYLPLAEEQAAMRVLPLPQLVAASTTEALPSLPSFAYLPPAAEASSAAALPWAETTAEERALVVGEHARRRAAEAPTRTVAAAKSWLCHRGVDRRANILPWQAPEEVGKISPLEAARRYLLHLVRAWDHAFPEDCLADQRVVLTVPASFDASARELTREAALQAGLPENLLLLEEPQAAVYAWLGERGDGWRQELAVGDRLLVVDVGGGTTDFSLIEAVEQDGELGLERLAVGQHILVGGDNMDLALAHQAQTQLSERGVTVDAWQSVALWHACRRAKESLLAADGPETHPVTVLGRGSRLIGGTVSVDLSRERTLELLLDGFFPHCELHDRPQRAPTTGFRELGLPYESDPAVSRHLAAFLGAASSAEATAPRAVKQPSRVLFNGGVFRAQALRRRVLEVLGRWFDGGGVADGGIDGGGREIGAQEAAIGELRNEDPDSAVARGAAYFAASQVRGGLRIRGGVGRSYYLGIETAGLAIPGMPRPLQALCVVPQGTEEGSELEIPGAEVGLVLGQTARFRLFSSTLRGDDPPGRMLASWAPGELAESDPVLATLHRPEGQEEDFVPVRFRARISELGLLELWCESTRGDHRWRLEFGVRDAPTAS